MKSTDKTGRVGTSLIRSLKIAAFVFLLGLGAIAVSSLFFSEPEHLDMDYEGFD